MLDDEQMARLAKIEQWELVETLPAFPIYTYPGTNTVAARWNGEGWTVNDSTCWRLMVKHRAYVAATLDGGWDFIVGNPARLASSGDPAEALALAILAAHPEDHHE
jgi:hypothetical protein